MSVGRLILATLIFSAFAAVLAAAGLGNSRGIPNLGENSAQEARPVVKLVGENSAPEILAKSAVVIDYASGESLFEKEANLRHLPASLTKLLTALVALSNCLPEDFKTVSDIRTEGSTMGLSLGDEVSVQTLLYGLLINSGNDAAYALSAACAPATADFVVQMNEEAKSLGMTASNFTNPAGLDDLSQYTNARDLARLAKAAVTNPIIAKIVSTKSIVVNDKSGIKTYYLNNINKLIGEVNGVEGIKTGQTEGASGNLITKTTRGGNSIITVVLGSDDRFEDTKALIEWTYGNYKWE